jgi:hypothetical protein
MQRRATATVEDFTPQAIANLMWGLATMGEKADRELLEAIQRRATATAVDFTPQAIANLMWALATLGERADRGLLAAMQRRGMATAGVFTPQAVANVLWALAVMGDAFLEGRLAILVDRLTVRILDLRGKFSEADKSQLHQWLLLCELGLASGASLPKGVKRVKQEIGPECLQAFTGQATHESKLQREVGTALKSTGMEVVEEFHDARSGYSIDVLVRRRSAAGSTGGAKSSQEPAAMWAVEVDGPTHFLGDGRTPRGGTLLKRRLLGLLGYTVVPVTFWEWNALKGAESKGRYLEDKIAQSNSWGGSLSMDYLVPGTE